MSVRATAKTGVQITLVLDEEEAKFLKSAMYQFSFDDKGNYASDIADALWEAVDGGSNGDLFDDDIEFDGEAPELTVKK